MSETAAQIKTNPEEQKSTKTDVTHTAENAKEEEAFNHDADQDVNQTQQVFKNEQESIKEYENQKKEKEQIEQQLSKEEAKEPLDDADDRSVFVKNVDYSADPAELKEHFQDCGEIKRVTILMDKISQQPKGSAYVEFASKEGAMQAKRLDESLFKGRQITVMQKRKNVPGRGRGARGGRNIQNQFLAAIQMMMGRGTRGRGRGGYRPF